MKIVEKLSKLYNSITIKQFITFNKKKLSNI